MSSGFPADPGSAEHGSSPESVGGKSPGLTAAGFPHRHQPAGTCQETCCCQPMRLFVFNDSETCSQPANKVYLL